MGRKAPILGVIFMILCLVFPVNAINAASGINATAHVSPNGSCQISLALTLHIEEPVSKLYFPIPAGASGVRVNGSRVITSKSGDTTRINLSRFAKNITGDVSVNLQYDLYGLVKETEIGTLELQLPLLSGFDYEISSFVFAVNLPGAVNSLPAFSSGYHQAGIEQDLTYTVEGATVSGNALKALKDHETLIMTLPVDDTLFPRVVVGTESTFVSETGMLVCGILAFLYWLIALRNFPTATRASEPPHGFGAGQIASIVGSAGTELSLMVFSWAQLGYVLIQPDRRGKVLLHKRMDMGNERSDYEQRYFQKLFGGRQIVDATGVRYANLCILLEKKPLGIQELLHKRSGNRLVFRVLLSGIGLFGGGGIGALMGTGAALQWMLIVLLALLGALCGWRILTWTDSGLLRKNSNFYLGLLLSALWLLLGAAAGNINLGLWMVSGLLSGGILYGWGGRRTDFGKLTRAQVLGLKRYLSGSDKAQLRMACEKDPDYFFRNAPYAMALGVGKAFSRAVGKEKLERCSYLTTGMDGHMSAAGWQALLEQTLQAMDARSKRLPFEKLMRILNAITKP